MVFCISSICEQTLSLPQQWKLIKTHTNLLIPKYYWGSKQFNELTDNNNVIHSDIHNLLHWSVSKGQQPASGFSFIKPEGTPLFALSIGASTLLTYEGRLNNWQHQQVINIIEQIRHLFKYFIFELLIFISNRQITFGCINIDIVRSQKNPDFQHFLEKNLLREYHRCLN